MSHSQLRKMVLVIEEKPGEFSDELIVLFNPNQISLNKVTKWHDQPGQGVDVGTSPISESKPVILDIELFFDTFEQQKDVREYTNRLYHLTTIEKQVNVARPPLCRILWGDFNLSDEYSCEWALESLDQKFTLFLGSGCPVRATLNCRFKQWRDPQLEAAMLNIKSQTNTFVDAIHEKQTLANFAHKTLGDARRWTEIARENNIVAPRMIKAGQKLSVNISNKVKPKVTRAIKASLKTQSVIKVVKRKVETLKRSGFLSASSSAPGNGAGGGKAKPSGS